MQLENSDPQHSSTSYLGLSQRTTSSTLGEAWTCGVKAQGASE